MQFTTTYILLTILWLKVNYGLVTINVRENHVNTSAARGTHQDATKRIIDEPTIPHNETCANPFEEFVSPVRGSPRCCRKCESGTGMLRLCSDLEDTQCTPCEPRLEFSPVPSATLKCQQCRKCQDLHPFAKTRTACTPTKDTECDCMKNYYMSVENQTCKPCTVCKPNEGVVKPCDWNADTQCQACPSGFWSALIGDAVKCIPCQTCSDDQILVRECLVNTDTVCCPKFNTNCSVSKLSSFDYTAYENGAEFSEHHGTRQNQMLPIYCSIMGMIIVFLLFYVIYKLWRQREAITNAKLSDAAYTVSGFKNITRAGGRSVSVSISPTGSGFQTVRCPNPDTCEVLSDTTETMNPCLSGSNEMHGVQERDPLLLGNVSRTQINETEHKEKMLDIIPVNVLGTLCYQLARKGCHKLANLMGITPNELSKSDPFYLRLLEATLQAKAFSLSTSTKRLRESQSTAESGELLCDAVNVICQLCKKSAVTLRTISDALESVDRADLIPLLTEGSEINDGLHPVCNSFQGGEDHGQV